MGQGLIPTLHQKAGPDILAAEYALAGFLQY